MKKEKIKISHVLTNLDLGGVQQVLLHLLTHQDKTRFEAEVIALSRSNIYDRGSTAELIKAAGYPVVNLEMGETWEPGDLLKLGRLVRYLRQSKPDIVQTYHFRSNLYGKLAARLAGVSLVVGAEHNITTTLFESHPRRALYAWLYRATDYLTDVTLVPSKASRQELVSWAKIPDAKISQIYNGIDTSRFSALDKTRAVRFVREKLGLSLDAPVAGFVGRLAEPKGVKYLLEAAAQVVKEVPQAHFVILGDGPLRQNLEQQATESGLEAQVHFYGSVANVAEWMAGFDLLVVPSLAEPFGLVAVEAMASALPVVASQVDGLAELVIPGETGLVVPPGDSSRLAAAVTQLLQAGAQERERLGEAGRNRVAEFFEVGQMTASYESFYQTLFLAHSKDVRQFVPSLTE